MSNEELLDSIEVWAERTSNALAATNIPMPPKLHVMGLTESMAGTLREMCALLKANGREVPTGEDE